MERRGYAFHWVARFSDISDFFLDISDISIRRKFTKDRSSSTSATRPHYAQKNLPGVFSSNQQLDTPAGKHLNILVVGQDIFEISSQLACMVMFRAQVYCVS